MIKQFELELAVGGSFSQTEDEWKLRLQRETTHMIQSNLASGDLLTITEYFLPLCSLPARQKNIT